MNDHTVQRLLAPLWRRIRLLISRGVVHRTAESSGWRRVQATLLRGETREFEHAEPYGFTSSPLKGAELIGSAIGAVRGHMLALVIGDRRYRPRDLVAGEVCLYTDEGDQIRFKRGRIIEVVAGTKLHVTAPETVVDCDTATIKASTKVTLDTPLTEATEDLVVKGIITGQAGLAITGTLPSGKAVTMAGNLDMGSADIEFDGLSSYRNHPHGGVEPGGGTSGGPQ